MIEQIKEALEKEETSWQARGEVSKEYRRWLRYLIGEVERLERDNKQLKSHNTVIEDMSLQNEYDQWFYQTSVNVRQKDNAIEELRKALEWYADEENHRWQEDENDVFTPPWTNALDDKGEIARQALERSLP